jgi:hypothetical protein
MNSGALYFPFPPKSTKLDDGLELTGPAVSFPIVPSGVHIPIICAHPLLNPGSTRLISSPKVGPFSVSHNFPLTGSKSIPKLLRIP